MPAFSESKIFDVIIWAVSLFLCKSGNFLPISPCIHYSGWQKNQPAFTSWLLNTLLAVPCLSKWGIRGLAVNMRKAQDKAADTDLTRGHSSGRAVWPRVLLFAQTFSCPLPAVPCHGTGLPLHWAGAELPVPACCLQPALPNGIAIPVINEFIATGNCCAHCIYNVVWRCIKYGSFGYWKSSRDTSCHLGISFSVLQNYIYFLKASKFLTFGRYADLQSQLL